MLFRDPPDHTRLRALVSRAFTPRVIEGMRGQIQAVVDRLLDQVERRGHMDVIGDLAYPLPVTVICDMLGVPVGDHEQMRDWSVRHHQEPRRHRDPVGRLGGRARARWAAGHRGILPRAPARAAPAPARRSPVLADRGGGAGRPAHRGRAARDLRAALHRGPRDHRQPDRQRPAGPAAAPRPSSSACARAGAARLARWRSCCATTAPCSAPPASPTRRWRWAARPIAGGRLRGHRHRRGQPRPARTSPIPTGWTSAGATTATSPSGSGIHFCLGAPLARVEGQLALGALMRRMPKLRLAGPELEWRESSTLRGLKALPVEF